jgi:hypothetical protein
MNGKSQKNWHLPIPPYSLTSIFSAVANSALLVPVVECLAQLKWIHFEKEANTLDEFQAFDAASRGPWGSFVFFWKTRRSPQNPLAYVGALIIVLALAFQPFIQQIIDIGVRPAIATGATSSVPSANGLMLQMDWPCKWCASTYCTPPDRHKR